MVGIDVVVTPKADWSPLGARPAGWKLRRVERTDTHSVYVTWDPERHRCAFFLTPPTPEAARSMTANGWAMHRHDALTNTEIWHTPVASALQAA